MSTPGLPTTNEEAWAVAGSWSPEREMSAFEALMWRLEVDPRLRSPHPTQRLLELLLGERCTHRHGAVCNTDRGRARCLFVNVLATPLAECRISWIGSSGA